MAMDDSKTSDTATIGQRLDHAIESTRDKLSHAAETAKEKWAKGRDAIADLRKKNLDDVVTSAKDFAKEHPGTTLIAGVALGFLIGFMVRGRRD